MQSYGFTRKTLVPLASALALAAATASGASAATATLLYSFKTGTSDGQLPFADVTLDSQGNIYGVTSAGGAVDAGVVYKVAPDGTETVLHSFVGGDNDGAYPSSNVLLDRAGNLYGLTFSGGGTGCGGGGCGTVYKLAPDGKVTLLHSFAGDGDGNGPQGDLLADAAGNLYGAAAIGGGDATCAVHGFGKDSGCGTLFKVAPDGAFTVLHTFENPLKQGAIPQGFLIADAQGNLYGVTETNGETTPCPAGVAQKGCGVVFKLSTSGAYSVLHAFTGDSDGGVPYGGPIGDAQGDLYGATLAGGNLGICDYTVGDGKGCGVLYKLTPGGTLTTLHTFTGGADGAAPTSRLTADCKGNLYGTAEFGGDDKAKACANSFGVNGCGTVFKITPEGIFSVLHTFHGAPKDGSQPIFTGVVADGAGNLYGATPAGGANGVGAVYKLTDTGFATTGKACSSAP